MDPRRAAILHANDGRAPGEAGAEGAEQRGLAGLDAPVAHRFVERDRDRGGAGVAVLGEVLDELLPRVAEPLGDLLDDVAVGLVGNDPVELTLVRPAALSACIEYEVKWRTVMAKSSGPCIRIWFRFASIRSAFIGSAEPPPGVWSRCARVPSAWIFEERMPRPSPSEGPSTTAPAPSPKRAAVVRSSGSTERESRSAPSTRMVLQVPAAMNWSATVRA